MDRDRTIVRIDRDASAVTEERRDAQRVALIGLVSGALYLVVYVTQWAIFRNGLSEEVAGILLRGDPADGSRLLLQGVGYYGATLLLFVLYAWILILCRRGQLQDSRARALALLFPVLFNAGLLLLGHPYQSIDALTYVAHGYMGNLPGVNPYTTTAATVRATDFARQLAPFGWLPVPYALRAVVDAPRDRRHEGRRRCTDRTGDDQSHRGGGEPRLRGPHLEDPRPGTTRGPAPWHAGLPLEPDDRRGVRR
jgi:hypothetical protein